MADPETLTIHAARIDKDGWRCIQFEPDGGWWIPEIAAGYPDLADLEDDRGQTRPVRIVTTDPADDNATLRAAVMRLDRQLAEEKAAHAKTRSNFEEYAEQQLATSWQRRQLESELRAPAGLSAEQELRARALHEAVTAGSWFEFQETVTDTVKLAAEFAGWIRDGSIPDAHEEN